MSRSLNELSPQIAEQFTDQANEMYYLHHGMHGVGTTYENWQACLKTVVERAGFDFTMYERWCGTYSNA